MLLEIGAVELRKALQEIERAESNGFMFCTAVLKAKELQGEWVELEYSDLVERAHPTDPSFNWGRFQGVTRRFRFVDGKVLNAALPNNPD